MWAKVDDGLTEHKKVFIAGARLGRGMTGRVLAVWLEGRLWANRMNTNGFIPIDAVAGFRHDPEPLTVAAALAGPITDLERRSYNTSSTHCLWEEVEGGFQIHDDEHYRPKRAPEEVRQIRSEAGRRGGQRSAEVRKQTKQTPNQNENQTGKQIASFASPADAVSACKSPPGEEANEASVQQNFNPVSRIPVPGYPCSEYPVPLRTVPVERELLAFSASWNERTGSPISPCLELTTARRGQITARLQERPQQVWDRIFDRIAASAFCRGDNDRGWVASIDWVIGTPEIGVRVLEGQFDTRARRQAPLTREERERGWRHLQSIGRCPHDPHCQSRHECIGNLVWLWREQERGVA